MATCNGPIVESRKDTPYLILSNVDGKYRFLAELIGELPYVKDIEPGASAPALLTFSGESTTSGSTVREWRWLLQSERYMERELTRDEHTALHERYFAEAIERWNSNID